MFQKNARLVPVAVVIMVTGNLVSCPDVVNGDKILLPPHRQTLRTFLLDQVHKKAQEVTLLIGFFFFKQLAL